MTKFGKIFCNLVANFKGVQLSPLGFAACQSKNCTNNANRAISRGCTCLKCTNKANSANYRREVCQNSLILKKSQSPDFHKPGLCYV